MNEGCGRKIRTRDADMWSNLADKMRREQPPTAERKVLEAILRQHPLEYSCCTIVHGDCGKHLKNLPTSYFDMVVSDPPYGMNITSGQAHHGPVRWDSKFPFAKVKYDLLPLAKVGAYFFCRWDNLMEARLHLPKPKSMLVWTKPGAGGTGDCAHEHIRDYEMAFFYGGPKHKFKKRPRSIVVHSGSRNPGHPTQKPVDLIKEIFSWYDFETVLDPYMGSGTTAIAALECKKHFLGFEADKKFYLRAIHRIAETKINLRSASQ
jgi:hypothetical protein